MIVATKKCIRVGSGGDCTRIQRQRLLR
jgi:hypothetical protein